MWVVLVVVLVLVLDVAGFDYDYEDDDEDDALRADLMFTAGEDASSTDFVTRPAPRAILPRVSGGAMEECGGGRRRYSTFPCQHAQEP